MAAATTRKQNETQETWRKIRQNMKNTVMDFKGGERSDQTKQRNKEFRRLVRVRPGRRQSLGRQPIGTIQTSVGAFDPTGMKCE